MVRYSKEMELLWDTGKNSKKFNEIDPSTDKTNFYWICNYKRRGCEFESSPKKVYHAFHRREHNPGSKVAICPVCKEVDFEDSIAYHAPEKVKKYWDNERNISRGLYPEFTKVSSNKKIFVKCDEHDWKGKKLYFCADLKDHIPCPACNGKGTTAQKNLVVLFPKLAEELHSKHKKYEILPYSSQECEWYCSKCKEYYPMIVSCRTAQNQGCPKCNAKHQTSKAEAIIKEILNKYIGGFRKTKFSDLKWRNGHSFEIDNFHATFGIAIEYDGYYYHLGKERVITDQEKLNLLSQHNKINVHIRIRDEELPNLKCSANQFIVNCGKHDNKYLFLLSALMDVFEILKRYTPVNQKVTKEQLREDLKEIVPTIHISGSFIKEEDVFALKYPGLVRYFNDKNAPNPYSISYGSSSHMIATCPFCKEPFPSTPKRLKASQGKCRRCLHYVSDIYLENSPLQRWYYKVTYEKSLEKIKPQLAKFYSKKNLLGTGEISANSHYPTIWDCPHCLEEYVATVDAQNRNGCKCQRDNCGKKALTI